MNNEQLIELRPKGATSDAIAEAIARIEAVQNEAEAAIVALNEIRPKLLLTGTSKDVLKIEGDLTERRVELEQLAAMRDALLPQLEQAKDRETLAHVRSLGEQAGRQIATATQFVQDEYPALAKAIASGLQLETEAMIARQRYLTACHRAGLNPGESGLPVCPLPYRADTSSPYPITLGSVVQLPAIREHDAPRGAPAYWQPPT